MITIQNNSPHNHAHFVKLLAFGQEVIATCNKLGITPLLTGSLAVFGYTQNLSLAVHDIDLACAETDFAKLSHALTAEGYTCLLKPWHVLQVRKRQLKVEFDSLSHWLSDLSDKPESLIIADVKFDVVSLPDLRELYRRGLVATAGDDDPITYTKHVAIAEKYALLGLV